MRSPAAIQTVFFGMVAAIGAAPVAAQSPPAPPLKLVVAAAAGTTVDAASRMVADALAAQLGHPVALDRRAGVGAGSAAETVAKAPPDGSVLLLATPAFAARTALVPHPGYDGLRAFAAVAQIAGEPLVLVAPASLPTSSVQELIALAKASPGRISYASAGAGSVSHLAGELFKSAATVQLAHAPAASADAALAEVVAGRARLLFTPLAPAKAALQGGTIKALAVTGPARLAALPEVPTMRESGVIDYEFAGWLGVLAPAATSKAVVERLNADLRNALEAPTMRERLTALLGSAPRVGTPAEFGALLRRDVATFEKLARELNLKVE